MFREKYIKNIKVLSEKNRNIEKYGCCYSINQWYGNVHIQGQPRALQKSIKD